MATPLDPITQNNLSDQLTALIASTTPYFADIGDNAAFAILAGKDDATNTLAIINANAAHLSAGAGPNADLLARYTQDLANTVTAAAGAQNIVTGGFPEGQGVVTDLTGAVTHSTLQDTVTHLTAGLTDGVSQITGSAADGVLGIYASAVTTYPPTPQALWTVW